MWDARPGEVLITSALTDLGALHIDASAISVIMDANALKGGFMSIIADHLTNSEIIGLIGLRLRQRRLERNLAIDDLARHSGVNRKTIMALESGEDVRVSSLVKILRSMNMLGLLEAAIPDSLPSGDALAGSVQLRQRAAGHKRGGRRG